MAGLIGVLLGLFSLIFPWVIWAKNWHGMEAYLKLLILLIPSGAVTIGILAAFFIVKELTAKAYCRVRGVKWVTPPETSRFDNWIGFLWIGVYAGLFWLCESLFT